MSLRTTRWASVLCAPCLLLAAGAARGDLLAYYQFDDLNVAAEQVILDSSGNQNNALARDRGGPRPSLLGDMTGVSGAAGDRAIDFTDLGDLYLPTVNNGADPGAFQSIIDNQAFTITYWSAAPAAKNTFTGWLQPGRSISLAPWSNDTMYYDTGGCCDGTTQRISAPFDPREGQWDFWAFTRNDFGDKVMYYNGQVIGQIFDQNAPLLGPDVDGEGTPIPQEFFIGSELGATNFFVGQMDEYAIFDEELTLNDLDDIYANGLEAFLGGVPGTTQYEPNPAADVRLVNMEGQLGGAVYSLGDAPVTSWKVERVFREVYPGTPDDIVLESVMDLTPVGAAGEGAVGDMDMNALLGTYPLVSGLDDETYNFRVTVLTEDADSFLGDVTQVFEASIVVPGSGGEGCEPLGSQGDINCDGAIDLVDFNILKANFGQSAQAVPEPSGLALLAGFGCCAAWALRRRRV